MIARAYRHPAAAAAESSFGFVLEPVPEAHAPRAPLDPGSRRCRTGKPGRRTIAAHHVVHGAHVGAGRWELLKDDKPAGGCAVFGIRRQRGDPERGCPWSR